MNGIYRCNYKEAQDAIFIPKGKKSYFWGLITYTTGEYVNMAKGVCSRCGRAKESPIHGYYKVNSL